MINVLIKAPLLSISGYGVHARQVMRWLLTKKDYNVFCAIVPWGITTWHINPDAENGLVGEIMKRSNVPEHAEFDMSIQLQLPNEWDPKAAKLNIGMTAFVETNKGNPQWVAACNKMDAVIVPSEFTKNVIENSGQVTTKLIVVPEAYPTQYLDKQIVNIDKKLNLTTEHNYLTFGTLTDINGSSDRKNTITCIKAFCETFKGRKDVGLIVRTNLGRFTTTDRAMCVNIFRKALSTLGEDLPRIYLLHGLMSNFEMQSLYKQKSLKALISCSRGEGYGLPMLEAASNGLPVLATNWSGYLDFLNADNLIPVNYELVDVHSSRIDGNIFVEGSKWAEIDVDDFKKKLSLIDTSDKYKKSAIKASRKIRKSYSQSRINVLYNNVLKELI